MSIHTISRVLLRCVRPLSFILLIAIFSIIGLTASAWAWLKSNTKSEPLRITARDGGNRVNVPQNNSAKREMVAVRLTIRPNGFEFSEITLPAKPFLFVIDNKSGLEEIVLQIHRITSGRRDKLRETRVSLKKLRKAEITDLSPGQYELTEANHPDWVCRIMIN